MWHFFSRRLVVLFLLALCGVAQAATTVCSVSYSTRNDWATGFVVDVVVNNSGAVPVSAWKVDWSYDKPVALVSAPWRATVKVDGNAVSATDNGANPTIAAGGKITFGMSLSYSGGTKPVMKGISVSGKDCIVAEVFYADPNSNSAIWVRNNSLDSRMADIRDNIAQKPAARWFGDWSGDIALAVGKYVTAAAALNQMPILVAYNIPARDCGQYSSGGANSIEGYKQWISAFASGVGARKAVIVLEPDAIPHLDCLSTEGKAARLELLRYAASQFKLLAPNALVYLDAGHSAWLSSSVAASRLVQAGVADVRGFSLNVSNFNTTASNTTYGNAIVAAINQQLGVNKSFVIDTSRNGNGPYGKEWCDPPGRKIGQTSTENVTGTQPEMTLWIKAPGNADGCAATAGTFVPDLAYKLIYGYY